MSESANKRAQRVGALIQETLAAILVDGLKDPRVGFVTVTEVRATVDGKLARVFVSVFGTEAERQASIDGLNDAAGFLRRELSHRMQLRYTPELMFVLDTTLDQAQRIETLMTAIHRGDIDTPPASAPDYAIPIATERSALAHSAEQFAAQRQAQVRKAADHDRKGNRRRNRRGPRAR